MKSAYVGVLSIIELKNARWNTEISYSTFPTNCWYCCHCIFSTFH